MTNFPKILCVDDEPAVLQGLALHLRRRYQMLTATSGAEGLELVKKNPDLAVVVSDMRMPVMNGSEFLARVREAAPDVVRMLLTGQADMESAIDAVNRGQIFRFLTKPCPPEQLLAALQAAVEQHRLITAEKELLEKTLHGSVQAMLEALSLASPAAFGRALRIRRLAEEMMKAQGKELPWDISMAIMFSQLGCITLPEETITRINQGADLSAAEKDMVSRLPQIADNLLSHIPRLEGVREIIRHHLRPFDGHGEPPSSPRGQTLPLGSRLIRLLLDYDQLESKGMTPQLVIEALRVRMGVYDPQLVDLLARCKGTEQPQQQVKELPLGMVQPGMIFVNNVYLPGGLLLVSRGTAASVSMIERIRNMPPVVREQRVLVAL